MLSLTVKTERLPVLDEHCASWASVTKKTLSHFKRNDLTVNASLLKRFCDDKDALSCPGLMIFQNYHVRILSRHASTNMRICQNWAGTDCRKPCHVINDAIARCEHETDVSRRAELNAQTKLCCRAVPRLYLKMKQHWRRRRGGDVYLTLTSAQNCLFMYTKGPNLMCRARNQKLHVLVSLLTWASRVVWRAIKALSEGDWRSSPLRSTALVPLSLLSHVKRQILIPDRDSEDGNACRIRLDPRRLCLINIVKLEHVHSPIQTRCLTRRRQDSNFVMQERVTCIVCKCPGSMTGVSESVPGEEVIAVGVWWITQTSKTRFVGSLKDLDHGSSRECLCLEDGDRGRVPRGCVLSAFAIR